MYKLTNKTASLSVSNKTTRIVEIVRYQFLLEVASQVITLRIQFLFSKHIKLQ